MLIINARHKTLMDSQLPNLILFPLLDSSIFCHFIFTPSLLLRHRRPLLSITVLGKRSTGRVGHVSIIFLSQAFREKAQLSFHAALEFFFFFPFFGKRHQCCQMSLLFSRCVHGHTGTQLKVSRTKQQLNR